MSIPILPSPTNFLAVALVINRSRDGPAFVFHYPANVGPVNPKPQTDGTGGAEPFELDDILLERLSQPATLDIPGNSVPNAAHLQQWNHDEHLVTDSGSQVVPWEHLAGFPTRDLARILTPSNQYHKKLFQLSLDPLYCVSYPIHVPENGSWKKRKKTNKSKSSRKTDELVAPTDTDTFPNNGDPTPATASSASQQPEKHEEGGKAAAAEEVEDKRSSMTMFNLVFILNPKKHEVKELINTLYFNIIKKINKAYKYSQQHSDFVWKESKRILALKEKGREEQKRMSSLWYEILATSSLAASVQDIYEAVSQNKIAALQLETAEGSLTPSFQIPVPFYIPDLPQEGEPDQSGLWLTTANSFVHEDALDEPGFLDRNFALLLMDDEKKIVAELQADSDPATVAMVEFVRLSKPTTSFYQVGQSNILTLGQVRKYAQHFIFWRRAIAIPPLHARDVYILSPNCPLRRLPKASGEWQKAFPSAPPLPNFLAELSLAPRPYKHFCPNKVHRPTYLLMLAWLMRGGWVTQLCTFAYVVVWPEILYEVDYQLEADELKATGEPPAPTGAAGQPSSSVESSDEQSSGTDTVPHVPTMGEQVAEKARLERIADKARTEAAEKATAHARKAIPKSTDHPSVNDAPHLAKMTPYIIFDAKKAAGKDSLYLSAIGKRFKDEKVAAFWPAFWKYFNGQYPLERIALQEDVKRKEAWALLMAMSEYLLCVRHW
jgi:nitrogen permease regulator 3-like protein